MLRLRYLEYVPDAVVLVVVVDVIVVAVVDVIVIVVVVDVIVVVVVANIEIFSVPDVGSVQEAVIVVVKDLESPLGSTLRRTL